MNKWVITSLFAISTLSASVASALEVRYVATPQQSTWQMATNTPLECRLVHPIPNYGDAEFSSRAGKKINLDFELKMRRPMGDTRNVSLVSMPPVWRPGKVQIASRICSFSNSLMVILVDRPRGRYSVNWKRALPDLQLSRLAKPRSTYWGCALFSAVSATLQWV